MVDRQSIRCALAIGGLITPQIVMAQEVPRTEIRSEPAEQDATAASEPQSEIIVTGSRIARRDFEATSPITTMNATALDTSGGVTAEAALNQLPQFAPSAGSSSNINNRSGQASANLRGLGPQRTLVLVDGRRTQAANPDGSADLNAIPDALIENVEVITGGASSTYGSDAVGGVVNFKLKRHFTGVQVDSQLGVTSRGDGGSQSVKFIAGADLDDGRGNIVIALNYTHRDGIGNNKRKFFEFSGVTTSFPQSTLKVAAGNLPTQAAVDAIFSQYGVTPGTAPRNREFGFNTDGTLFIGNPAINYRDPAGNTFVDEGNVLRYSGGRDYLLRTPLTRYGGYARVNYDLTDDINVYADLNVTQYKVTTQVASAVLGGTGQADVLVPLDNPFIPEDLRQLAASRPNPDAPLSITRRLSEVGLKVVDFDYDIYQATIGAQGKLGIGDWTWDVYGSKGRTKLQTLEDAPQLSQITSLITASDGGMSRCAGGFDAFGLSTLSTECFDYIMRPTRSVTVVEQSVAEANFQGGLVTMPAGEVRLAVGAAYRHNSFDYRPDEVFIIKDIVGRDATSPSGGSDEVAEAYFEALVPLLGDLPLIHRLELTAGYRYSDYRSVSGVHTYKGDLDWRITESLRARGGYSRAIRAPSVGELFSGATEVRFTFPGNSSVGYGDPCDVRSASRTGADGAQVAALCLAQGVPQAANDFFQNQNARLIATTTGNPDLNEEVADTISAGIVWRPRFTSPLFSQLSLSVDYYKIKVKDAIGSVTTQLALNKCFNLDGTNPTYSQGNYYCSLITRSSTTGGIDSVANPALNLGGFRTSGVDAQIDWRFGLGAIGLNDDWGALQFTGVVNYLEKFEISTAPGEDFIDYAGTNGNSQIDPLSLSKPKWKFTTSATYAIDGFQTTLRYRFIGAQDNAVNAGNAGTIPGVKAVSYLDLDFKADVNDNFQLRAGVVNLTDVAPPQFGPLPSITDVTTYDLEGRRFYVGVKATF